MTKDQVLILRSVLQSKLDEIATELGYKLTLGNASFSATATFKLECAPLNEEGEAVDKNAEEFKKYAKMLGFLPTDLGREFRVVGKTYRLSGCKTANRRFPILAMRDGKTYKFPAESVKEALKSSP